MFRIYLIKRKLAQKISKILWAGHVLSRIKAFLNSSQHRVVKHNTKIVIEGPPRCGNSSALRLVIRNNKYYLNKIATHIHRPFQIYYGIKFGIPMVIMLRNPSMSCVSHASLLIQLKQVKISNNKQKEQLLFQCFSEYIDFLNLLIKYNFKNILIFEDYIKRPNLVIELLNSNYNLELDSNRSSHSTKESIHVYPSQERDEIKNQFEFIIQDSKKLPKIIEEAQRLYKIACKNKRSYY